MANRKSSRPIWLAIPIALNSLACVLAHDGTPTEPPTATTPFASSSPYTTTMQTSFSTSTFSEPQTHTIQVGLLDHKMRPETTEAAVGDIVEFAFYPLNHSIVRAEYGFPCIPYEMTGLDKKGFFSGFNPVNRVLDKPPKYTIRVNDSEPIFFYCSAPGSCITYGMVGGINLNSSTSIDKQRTLAMDSSYMLQPNEPFPAESPLPSNNPASSIITSSSPTSTPAATQWPSSGGLSTGAIAGITIAAVLTLIGAALLFFFCGRNKSLREAIERRNGTVHRNSASVNQMLEYRQPNAHAHSHTASFQFPSHPAAHPGTHQGSPDMGYVSHQANMGGYSPAQGYDARKYTTSTAAHSAYHVVSPGSPPPGSLQANGHPFIPQAPHDPRGGTPVPGYYETFLPNGQQVQERAVEMEAITAVNQAEADENNSASKF